MLLTKLWDNKKFLFVFIFSLCVLIFFSGNLTTYDEVWNYSFSYAISQGQVPFRDFNMIVPGFYNFVMSLGLSLFSDSILVYFIEQALLITIAFCFLNKMYGKKSWLFLLAMCLPLFIAFSATYNFGILVLVIIILYLEKNKKSDYLIGILLGLCILTKHSIGIFMLIPSIVIYFNDFKKLLKRAVGVIIPWGVFVVYLVATGSFLKFIDLCILGMFDFAGENTSILPIYFILSIILLMINIWYVVKNKKDIVGYYVLCSFSVMIPIFSHYHFYIYLVFMSLLSIEKIKLDENYIRNMSLLLIMILVVCNWLLLGNDRKFMDNNNFEGVYIYSSSIDNFNVALELYNKYKELGDTKFLASTTVWLNITNDEKLDSFSVLNRGNYGYNGTSKMIELVKNTGERYYIINYFEYLESKNDSGQFDTEILEFIMDNGKFIEEFDRYKVYYYE